MSSLEEVRTFALSLPEATTQDHHGMESFRVRGRIFATVPDDGHIRVMLDEPAIEAAVAEFPDCCAPYYWGARLACAVVSVASVPEPVMREWLTDAWRRKAPVRLVNAFDGR